MDKQFDFGENWKEFSFNSLTEQKIENSKADFLSLIGHADLKGKTFLDIGFGQGLIVLIAASHGAVAVGVDINDKCRQAMRFNQSKFSAFKATDVNTVIGSILDDQTISEVRKIQSNFDYVYSWGVLHHTGDMLKAIKNSISLVAKNGHFVLAIYNRHWTAKYWYHIKKFYNASPKFVQKPMVWGLYLATAMFFGLQGKNVFKKMRGMNYYYDVVDWIGGYPYEFASKEEICQLVENKGFKLVDFRPTEGWTGCNEFVFKKVDGNL